MFLQRKSSDCGCSGEDPQLPVQKGDKGDKGDTGLQGYNGWSAITANVFADNSAENVAGSRVIEKFISWTGGTGTPPATPTSPNIYLGSSGWTTIALATDKRGASGVGTLPDTGWQYLNFGVSYPGAGVTGAPMWRIVGNRIDFKGNILIAPTVPNLSNRDSDNLVPDSTYFTTSGQNGGAEALISVAQVIPLGTTVNSVTLPGSLPENITLVTTRLTRRVPTSDNTVFISTVVEINAVTIRTDGKLTISTLQDAEIDGSITSTIGTDPRRLITSKVVAGEYVMDFSGITYSNASNASKNISISPLPVGVTYTYTLDGTNANYLGGFNINFRNTSGFIS